MEGTTRRKEQIDLTVTGLLMEGTTTDRMRCVQSSPYNFAFRVKPMGATTCKQS